MTLLRLEDVSVTYRTADGPVPAVRGVSLELEAGSTLGVAGESGSGKSTVAATVLRLNPASATVTGRVLLDDEDVLAMNFGRLRAVRWAEASIVFQGALHSLNPLQKIGRQVAEPVLLHGQATTRRGADAMTRELLGQVGLPPRLATSYPHQLSGGQKQRVMIAMALACGPRLIIADEPTTALDVMVQAQVLDLLTDLVRDLGVGLVVISHDLSVLGTTCDRLAVMYAGRVVEQGAVRGRPGPGPAPVHPGAVRRVPDASATRRPGSHRAACPATRPGPATCRPAALPPALPGGRGRVPHRGRAAAPGRTRAPGRLRARRRGGDRVNPRPVLEAAGLSTSFRARGGRVARAVDGVDLELGRGEIVALVGESGCGKTTLARTLLGLERPSAGQVLVGGVPLRYDGRALKAFRRRVQLVLQDPTGSLNPRHTVYEAVAEGLRVHGVAGDEQQRVVDALSRVGMRPAERYFLRYPHELSGGQRQRVVIAGALVLEPEVLVADEPVSSLDASVRGRDPGAAAPAARRAGSLGARGDPRPRAGVEHRRPDRGDVPRPDRRERPDRAGAGRPLAPLHPGPAVGRAREPPPGAGRARRRAAGPDQDAGRLPLPPALPAARLGGGRRGRRGRRLPHRQPAGAARLEGTCRRLLPLGGSTGHAY